jgi:hypothetical protein
MYCQSHLRRLAMRDPYVHAEKTSLPGFGHQAIRALLTDALGVAPDLPKTVATGCGLRRPLASTSTVPEEITCLACREWLRGECLVWADTAARTLELAGRPGFPTTDDLRGEERTYRALAARFEATR